jgi:tetratricopeptide (TPR) repeat protein
MDNQTRRLPLFVALVAFVVYLATMGSELTLNGLPLASKLGGWDQSPMVGQPLLWLLTLPLHLLPGAWVPLALKVFAAALAALVLGVLARTVQLLPWDHPWESASRLVCVLPVLTAGVICGFEFSFWQEATSTCGDLLDVLLMAVAAWLLLEYNVRQQSGWLAAAAVVWGAGMTENWLMMLAFPLFVVAVIWIERLRFLNWRHVGWLAALGLAGFSLYVLLPMVNGLMPHSPWTLGQSWKISLHETKVLVLLPHAFWKTHRTLMMAVFVYFLVPTLPLLVRMRDEGTRNKPAVDRFQIWLYRALRLGLLLACLWLAFDPAPAARQMLHHDLAHWQTMLTFDYLVALGAAFLVGNLLLISQIVVRDEYHRPRNGVPWRRLAGPIGAAGLALVAGGLLVRNAPAIVHSNFHPLECFGDVAVESLPSGRGVILSDHPDRMLVFRVALDRGHRAADWLTVDTAALPFVKYRADLEKRLPAGWLTDKSQHELKPWETLQLLEQVARTNRLFYLHPSFGLFFEGFYLEPSGSIYEMKRRGKNPLDLPSLPDAAVAANEQFWTTQWDHELSAFAQPAPHSVSKAAGKRCFGLVPAPRDQDRFLKEWLSIPLEAWAVTLQQQGHLREAQARFEEVLRLNTNNLSARFSLNCNTNLQAGTKLAVGDLGRLASQLGNPEYVTNIVIRDGPFDEPAFDCVLALVFIEHGLRLQAAGQLERTLALAPDSLLPQITLADVYNQLQMPERSRPLIEKVREQIQKGPANSTLDMDLALLDSYAWLLQTNVANAREALRSLTSQHPDDPKIIDRVIAAYVEFNDVTNAMGLIGERLARTPDDISILWAKADILARSGHPADAALILDHVVALTNLPQVLVRRAFDRIDAQDFDKATNELRELEKNGNTNAIAVADYGFALMAEHGADTNSAKHYLQLCLSNSSPVSALWLQADARLHRLGPPVK